MNVLVRAEVAWIWVTLAASPIHVGEVLRKELFQSEMIKSVVMTNATLATGPDDNFAFYRSRIGLSGGMSLRVGSPFDYQLQAKLVILRGLPDPSRERQQFERACLSKSSVLKQSDGHAFVLFTSYDLLRRCADALGAWLAEQQMQLFSQAGNQNRTQLLDAFRKSSRGVLFGTDSFLARCRCFQAALTNVIINKLPLRFQTISCLKPAWTKSGLVESFC